METPQPDLQNAPPPVDSPADDVSPDDSTPARAPRWMYALTGMAVVALALVGTFVALSILGPEPAPRTMAELKIAAAQAAVKRNPSDAAAHLDLGGAYLEVGKDNEAITEFSTVIKLVPDNYIGYYALANAYVVTDRPDEAIKMFVKAIDRVPGNGALYYGLGDLYVKRGQWANAVVVLEVGVKVEPTAADMRILLARAYEKTGKATQALAEYREALRYTPGSQEASAAVARLQATDKGSGKKK